jgi:hypothetical protein
MQRVRRGPTSALTAAFLWGPIWGAGVGERVDPRGECGGASLLI